MKIFELLLQKIFIHILYALYRTSCNSINTAMKRYYHRLSKVSSKSETVCRNYETFSADIRFRELAEVSDTTS